MNTAKPTGGIGNARPMRPADAEPDTDRESLPLAPEPEREDPQRMVPRQPRLEPRYEPEEVPRPLPQDTGLDRRMSVVERDLMAIGPAIGHHARQIERFESLIGERDERIAQLGQALAQAQAALDNHAQHLVRMDQHMNAMAQQIARNIKLAAADVVFKSRTSAEPISNLLKAVREVYAFFIEPEPQAQNAQDQEPQPLDPEATPERLN